MLDFGDLDNLTERDAEDLQELKPKPRYVRCNQAIGMQSCNLPLGHNGDHEELHCCLCCTCSPCICNKR